MRKYILFFLFGILSVLTVFFAYQGVKRVIANFYFEKGIRAMTEAKDGELAIKNIQKAISFYTKDEYFRIISEMYLIQLNELSSLPQTEDTKEKIDQVLEQVMRNLEKAVEVSPDNYQNWLVLGKTHSALIQSAISLEGSRKAARDAYKRALALDPKDLKDKSQIYFFLSQIEIIEENNVTAVSFLKKAIDTYPSDPTFFLQLGILKYREGSFKEAVQSLEEAVALVPDYADARYFLGLSYYRMGNPKGALIQFERVARINPDNNEVRSIVTNLKAGQPPFEGWK